MGQIARADARTRRGGVAHRKRGVDAILIPTNHAAGGLDFAHCGAAERIDAARQRMHGVGISARRTIWWTTAGVGRSRGAGLIPRANAAGGIEVADLCATRSITAAGERTRDAARTRTRIAARNRGVAQTQCARDAEDVPLRHAT